MCAVAEPVSYNLCTKSLLVAAELDTDHCCRINKYGVVGGGG